MAAAPARGNHTVSCYFHRLLLVFTHLEFQDGHAYLPDTSQNFTQIFNLQPIFLGLLCPGQSWARESRGEHVKWKNPARGASILVGERQRTSGVTGASMVISAVVTPAGRVADTVTPGAACCGEG